MAKTVDDFLDDEQAQGIPTDILSRIDNVIQDTQRTPGKDVPFELWRRFQLLGTLALI